ncbi:MAG: MBL fold metallo-hydrolase [Desulfobacterales bacterium]|nr:MBL fold metallo-hydrolase [Desulfobacterales bacterium]
MNVTFYGGTREVTGSMHLLSAETNRILLDCGMFQGRRKESEQKNRTIPIDPQLLTNVILSHAHIDHSGRIPLLVKNKFKGSIICTRPTNAAIKYLLLDSAHIQESDANYINYKTLRSFLYEMKNQNKKKKNEEIKSILKKDRYELNKDVINSLIKKNNLEYIKPIYTEEDANDSLKHFEGYPYEHPITIGNNLTCTFYEAGHILGSAISIIKHNNKDGKSSTIAFTGDIGRFNKPILKDPTLIFKEEDRDIDLLIIESTYGNRYHEPVTELKSEFKKVLTDTFNKGGTLLIPAFAYGRTQELIYVLHELYNESEIEKKPVYIDSPLASNLTKVFGEYPETYDEETHHTFLEHGENPFYFNQVEFISSVKDSMALMQEDKSHIVIASSGMCEAGRILHHLRYKIHSPKNTILTVGFMAKNTLGSKIQELSAEYEKKERKGDAPEVKILNKLYPLKAKVSTISGFSAHADKNELIKFLKESNLRIKKIAIVHGEEEQSLAFAESIKNEGFDVIVPNVGETVSV